MPDTDPDGRPDWERVRELFSRCVDLDATDREAKLRQQCGSDDRLRREVEDLLALSERGARSLKTPPAGGPLGGIGPRPSGLPATGDRLGPYRIAGPLAQGGMGAVFRAVQEEPLRRDVAIKVIREGLSGDEVLARFERERQTLARMEHECIARVHDAGTTAGGEPYFVMEYVPGPILTRFCDDRAQSVEERLRLFRQICNGVHHAHQRGVLHRDLKPGNILVVDRAEGPVPKIIDFGIARAVAADGAEETLITLAGGAVGTPAYMSPEQAAGSDDLDLRTDVFSLGVLLYELLTGELPSVSDETDRPGVVEMQRRIVHDEPDKPSTRVSKAGERMTTNARSRRTTTDALRRRLCGDLDWIVMKALEKDRDRRYASAHELADDIARHLNDLPVLAGPPSATYRLRKFSRRHRLAVAAGALAVLSLVAGTIVSTLSMFEARESQRHERQARLREERRSYLANVAAAAYAVLSGNGGEARLRLDECPDEQRGFEWDHLDARLAESERACLLVLEGHEDTVFRVACGPGDDEFTSASTDGTIRIWTHGSAEPRLVIAAEPSPPASQLPQDGIFDVAVSPDGRHLVSGHFTGQAILRDADDGRELHRVRANGQAMAVAFSPNGADFMVADSLPVPGVGSRIRSFSVDSGELLTTWVRPGPFGTYSLVYDRDGDRWLEGGRDLVRISDARSGTVLSEHSADGFTTSLDWSSDGAEILTCGVASRRARRLDASSGELLATLQNPSSDIHAARFLGDDGVVLTGDTQGRLQTWNDSTQRATRTLLGHARAVQCMTIDTTAELVVTGSEDHTVRVWSLNGPRALRRWSALPFTVDRTVIRPDGAAILAVTSRGLWSGFDADGAALELELPFPSWTPGRPLMPPPGTRVIDAAWHPTDIDRMAVAFLPDGPSTHRDSGRLLLWDGRSAERRVVETGEQIWLVQPTPDGRRVLCVGVFGTVTSVAWDDGRILGAWPLGDGMGISQIQVDRSGRTALVIVMMNEVIRFDVETGEIRSRLPSLGASIHDAVFSTDGSEIFVTEGDEILVRDATTGTVVDRWPGHRGTIRRLALSPDGRRLVSCGADRTVRFWDPADGSLVLTLREVGGDARAPSFSPDGSFLVAGDSGGALTVWRRALPAD